MAALPPQVPLDAGLSLDELEQALARDKAEPIAGGKPAAGVPDDDQPHSPAEPPVPELKAPPIAEPPVAPVCRTGPGRASNGGEPSDAAAREYSTNDALPESEREPAPEVPPGRRNLLTILGWEPEQTPLFTSWLVSLAVHIILVLALAAVVHIVAHPAAPLTFFAPADGVDEQPIEFLDLPATELSVADAHERPSDIEHDPADQPTISDLPPIAPPGAEAAAEPPQADPTINSDLALPSQLLRPLKSAGGGLEGRDPQTRSRLVILRGGTPGSEEAVARALRWLAAHQRPGGSWRFDLDGPCKGQCANAGNHGSTTAATGLALLPFLGAGQTPERGEYRDTVKDGIYYLAARMLDTPYGGDLQEGTMYSQGIATVALCEAYAMTKDPALKRTCQRAIDFICHAQHTGGGWRYFPGQPGDMTVFGWQFMALKSGQLANLEVPSPVIERAGFFLDTMQSGNGAYYGYLKPGRDPTPTSVGLLSRMYLGWDKQDPRLAQGTAWLGLAGPSKEDMYFNYYATQVLHHSESDQWPKWNKRMRDYLVAQQAKAGHETGSWYFADPHGQSGGRLYCTALSTMILEVYYRHMPLYDSRAVDESF